MKFLLVASKKDKASLNMYSFLKEEFTDTGKKFWGEPILKRKNAKLVLVNKPLINFKQFTKTFKPDITLFLSKHSAKSGIPSLTTHSIGIFNDDTRYGGKPYQLGHSAPIHQTEILRHLNTFRNKEYDITFEATHHGPYLPHQPSIFVEMGSDIGKWQNENTAQFMKKIILKTLKPIKQKNKIAIGIGDQHYPRKFTKLAINGEYDFGHIAPRYVTKHLNKKLIQQMINRSTPKPEIAIISKQSTNRKGKIKTILKELNFPYKEV